MTAINGQTKLIGIFGNPIAHTASPRMHNAAFRHLNLNYAYVPFLVQEPELASAVTAIRALNLAGVNVTVPFKEKVLPYLDDLSEAAAKIGAVNTIVNRDGKLVGYNTDGEGFLVALNIEAGVELKGKVVAILGAGGSARGIAFELLRAGVSRLILINRSEPSLHSLVDHLKIGAYTPIDSVTSADPTAVQLLKNADIVVNTTSAGMSPNEETLPIEDTSWLSAHHVLYDIVYKPSETRLMAIAASKGVNVHGGLSMLIGQGAIAFELFTGHKAPYSIMKSAVLNSPLPPTLKLLRINQPPLIKGRLHS